MELINSYFPQLTADQKDKFEMLQTLYEYWNERINVISRKDIEALYERHVLHSLSIAKIMHFDADNRVLDIGTGGGFPGIPLAILFPNTRFVLVDSIGKKIKVCQAVIEALQLENVTAYKSRAEELTGEKFDVAVTRAVAPINKLATWSRKQLKTQNQGLICLKGGDLRDEIKESGLKTTIFPISDFFHEPFFETKVITWSTINP